MLTHGWKISLPETLRAASQQLSGAVQILAEQTVRGLVCAKGLLVARVNPSEPGTYFLRRFSETTLFYFILLCL